MASSRTATILRYSLIALVLIFLSGLGWWYFFLRAELDALRASDTGRGAGLAPPSFGGVLGSTYNNIIERLSPGVGEGEKTEGPQPRLREITGTPVAGFGFIARGTSSGTSSSASISPSSPVSLLRFIERGTGYIVDAELAANVLMRRTNTLVPQVYEGLVATNGNLILRSVDEVGSIITYLGVVAESEKSVGGIEATSTALALKALPRNIHGIALNPAGEEVLYILEGGGRVSVVRAVSDGSKPQTIATLGIVGWQVRWLGDDRIILVQNAEDGLPGYAYELRGGNLFPVIRSVVGFSFLPRTNPVQAAQAGAILYSSGFTLFARANANTSVITLPLRTTVDKCVWSPGAQPVVYCAVPKTSLGAGALGRWLRGEIHSADAWWKIDVRTNQTELLYESEAPLDVREPTISAEGTYIAFLNEVNKSLWLLRIAE